MSGCGAVGSALALGARGRQFESGHPDHTTLNEIELRVASPCPTELLAQWRLFYP